ncbi:hypothetical protein EJP82_23730 [Paenibacillus anaericanus]|uniref:Imm-5-like domain-containing protein n=1 Tax=Paenibacillus anaericanus TaxID=170367 RepID=A0A3S1EAG1_9BACL|nr:hypothetical protein [Paenibacillus anaericanus]RUT41377.1 hypothetical protein EJP82_23730 [Paenibacillus anaericanus]
MASKPKIKIFDHTELRNEIDKATELVSQVDLAEWAIRVARQVLPYLEQEFSNNEKITNGFKVNELWQIGEATVYQVRQAGFKVEVH